MLDILLKSALFPSINTILISKHISERHIYIKHYNSGSTLYNQNDCCNTLDIVISGGLVAYSLAQNGSATTMFEFKKDSIIGANLLLGDNHTYPLNIYCASNSQLIHITAEAVLDFLHDYNFVLGYIKSLSQNSQGMNKKIAMFTQKTLRANILDYLLQLSIAQNSKSVILSISKKQLADYFGVQRQSLFRELKKLKDDKIIDIKNNKITIIN